MFGGFDSRESVQFMGRARGPALVVALALFAGVAVPILTHEPGEETVEVALEPEIKDLVVEEAPEPEVQEEPPPPAPPPPKNVQVKKVKKLKPKPEIKTPDKKVTDAVDETSVEKVVEVLDGPTVPAGTGTQVAKPKPQKTPPPKPEPKPEPKPKAKPAGPKIDPSKPVDRPEKATAPKPKDGNPDPGYPKELRDKGITGRVVLKIHVHRDGSVRGAKILSKTNNATGEDEQNRANQLFLKAVIAVVKGWKFEPSTLNGQPISVWHKVTFPFELNTG